jgi:hypothetical protein
MPVTLRPRTYGSKGHPVDLLSDPHCARTKVAPAEDSDTTREDVPLDPFSTRSWTRAIELRRSFSLASTFQCFSCTARSHPTASSRRLAGRT